MATSAGIKGPDGDESARGAYQRAGEGASPALTRAPKITPEPPTERRAPVREPCGDRGDAPR
jgi:hypothetical protein